MNSSALTPQRPSNSSTPLWGAACFLLSGAAGLLYEVAWSKQIAYLLGSSLHSVATVVAAFLGGLALGARVLGVPLARRGHGPRTYALLEVGIAVLALALLPALRAVDPWIGEWYRSFGSDSYSFALARLALVFALLLPPAALMGATLPVLVAHFERDRVGPALAQLYAINTLGAVLGSVLAGFVLLPGIGLTRTTMVAAALNIAAAAIAMVMGRRGAAEPGVSVARPTALPLLHDGSRRVVYLLFALSGFTSLAFQIAWVRLFALVFGSSVYSFSGVLGVYLLGLALGSALVGPLVGRVASLSGFAIAQILLAAAAALMTHAFARLPEWMFALSQSASGDWWRLFGAQIGIIATLITVPCALLGALFPLTTRLLQRGDGGLATGSAYLINTVGTISGSLAAGFLLIPRLGVQGTHLLATGLAALIGVAALTLALRRGERHPAVATVAVVGMLAAGFLGFLAPRWDAALMAAGAFRPVQARTLAQLVKAAGPAQVPVHAATRDEVILFQREGINASVIVARNRARTDLWMRVGGKIDASLNDMETQVLLGLIPAALADSGARTLIVGHGSGFTAAAALSMGVGPTEILELEQGVLDGSRLFHVGEEDPLDDPRVSVILGDARTHLLHGAGRYDLIISEPTNPWIAGVNNLFTVDFYRRVRERLEPGGVFCQWMQLYELSEPTFASMVSSLLEVFPDGHVFCVWRAVDVLFIAAPQGRSLDLHRLRQSATRGRFERAGVPSPEALAGYYAGAFADLSVLRAGALLNRDDRPVVEYQAPRDLIRIGTLASPGDPQVVGRVPFSTDPPGGGLFAEWDRAGWYAERARLFLRHGDTLRAGQVERAARALGLEQAGRSIQSERSSAARADSLAIGQTEARALLAAGRFDEALARIRRQVADYPEDAASWVLLGERLRVAGDREGAANAAQRGVESATGRNRAAALLLLGMVRFETQRPSEALQHFREVQRMLPDEARGYAFECRALIATGDLPGARAALERGLARLPDNPMLLQIRQQLASGSPSAPAGRP